MKSLKKFSIEAIIKMFPGQQSSKFSFIAIINQTFGEFKSCHLLKMAVFEAIESLVYYSNNTEFTQLLTQKHFNERCLMSAKWSRSHDTLHMKLIHVDLLLRIEPGAFSMPWIGATNILLTLRLC